MSNSLKILTNSDRLPEYDLHPTLRQTIQFAREETVMLCEIKAE